MDTIDEVIMWRYNCWDSCTRDTSLNVATSSCIEEKMGRNAGSIDARIDRSIDGHARSRESSWRGSFHANYSYSLWLTNLARHNTDNSWENNLWIVKLLRRCLCSSLNYEAWSDVKLQSVIKRTKRFAILHALLYVTFTYAVKFCTEQIILLPYKV